MSQSNVQAVKAKLEEQYSLSNMIYQVVASFSLRSILKLLKCTQTNYTVFVMEFIFLFAVLPKICFSTSAFQDFCSDLFCRDFQNFTNFCFPENLLATDANRSNVLKIFISLKVTVYMQDRRLRSEKALDA